MIMDWVTLATPWQIWETFSSRMHVAGALGELLHQAQVDVAALLEIVDQVAVALQGELVGVAHVDAGLVLELRVWLSRSAIFR